jgi:uncharacterized membrane protein
MNRQDAAADRVLALTLKAGAYTAFALIVDGLIFGQRAPAGVVLAKIGLIVLLATPGLRIVAACIQFFRERDFKYALISLGVLGIVILAYCLGIQT